MLIEHYDLTIFSPPREATSEKFSAFARFTTNISEVLPYLNATLPGANYQHATTTLTWKKGTHHLTVYAQQIALGNIEDYDLVEVEIEEVIGLINQTWERRAEISPDFEPHQRPPLMAVYKLLPRTNCRQCGEPTCYAFAIKLIAAQQLLDACSPLLEPQYASQLLALQAQLSPSASRDI